jgi:CDP-diacylglycerol--serine O-phosphatidyltransferase
MKKHIPNLVTSLNLFSGSISIVFAFGGNLELAAWFIGLAAVFDFFDGMLARLLNARSAIGLQLDSLADMISFGFAPAVIVFQLMEKTLNQPFLIWYNIHVFSLLAFIITVFSALRLAKFNIDDGQTVNFIGLPTPANALFFASLPLALTQADTTGAAEIQNLLSNYWILLALVILFSGLLVSNIPLFSMKFKSFSWRNNKLRYVLITGFVILFAIAGFYALPLIIVFYLLLSIVFFREKTVE